MTTSGRPDFWLSLGLAFVGGYGDAAGFVLAKTFTGHITGSMVLGAIAVAARDWHATITHLSAIVTFLLGVILSSLAMRPIKAWPSWPPLSTIMTVEIILIVAATLAWGSHASHRIEVFVVSVSLALGLQNGAFRSTGGISVHTTYLTGLVTGLIATEIEKRTLPLESSPSSTRDPKTILLFGIWITFVLGAVTGAAMVFRFREFGILGVALILFAIIVSQSATSARMPDAP